MIRKSDENYQKSTNNQNTNKIPFIRLLLKRLSGISGFVQFLRRASHIGTSSPTGAPSNLRATMLHLGVNAQTLDIFMLRNLTELITDSNSRMCFSHCECMYIYCEDVCIYKYIFVFAKMYIHICTYLKWL